MNKLDIGTLLASLIHESKNTVGHLMFQTQTAKSNFPPSDTMYEQLDNIESDLKRLNDCWVEYLYLYKLASNGYDIQCDTYAVDDFLDEQVFVLKPSAKEHKIGLTFICDANLIGIFDERLLISVISTGFYNALRFAHKQIIFKAEKVDHFLVISIEDDGCGFDNTEDDGCGFDNTEDEGSVLTEYNTSLGLHFAELTAKAHSNNKQHGYIEKASSETLGGASLKIYLPQ
ncbi:HAMP domain-containing histidine kinase [Marinomonas agarivorans]|nr:HAMP domain-containing histidine kinase [Marinomonas agarivorans]